ncbi:MipA/OmpV family protein [Yoonia sp. BS5-3]|uniref:MipA/OmpV family protein n=1 Tax=Yoonia phaeophyticola TaxID=3137369 RepID=A0ABZ2UZ00_9RHOB
MRPIILACLCLPTFAAAQDAPTSPGISFTFGVGPQSRPAYSGSETYEGAPKFRFSLHALEFGPISRQPGTPQGLRFRPSFGIVGARSADDHDELSGLEDIDLSLELGGGVSFTTPDYEVFAKLRHGVTGHEAQIAEFGGDLLYRPAAQWELSIGPRVLWGSEDYAQTYYGVSAAESAASSFDAFEAGAGIVSAGIEAGARYQINDVWGLEGAISYEQLQNDAADSPITQSADQIGASLVVTRRFSLGF